MKRFLSLVFAALLPIVGIAHAQQSQWLWWGETNPIPVTATNPLPVTVSGGLSVMKTDASNAVLPDALNNLGLGTTSTPQFGAIGLGTPATSLGLNLNFSTAVPSSPIVYAHGNIFGSTIGSGVQSAYTFNVDNDSIDASSATGAYGFYSSLGVGQATAKGNRTGGFFGVTQKSPTGNTAGSGSFYTALGSMGVADANDNGIVGVPSGAMFGFNAVSRLTTNATFYNGMSSAEFDVAAEGASSLQYKTGLSIVQLLSDLNQGVLQDTALLIANQGSGTAPGWKCGICYGGPVGWWPITSTGTMMGTQSALAGGPAYAAAHGIDFSAVTFSSDFLKSTGFLVDPSGNTTTPNVTVGAGTISGASIRATGHANTGLWFVSGTSAALTTNGVQTLEVSNTGGIRVYGGAPSTGLTVSAATFGGSVTNGGVYAGRGSTNDVTLQNSGGTIVAAIPTGSTNLNVPGAITDNGTAPTGTAGSGYARATSPVFVTPTLGAASATSVTGLSAPVNGSDATNKTYVDAIASGIVTHASAQAATTANLTPVTLSGTGVGKTITNAGAQVAFAVDGYNGIVNDRILVKNQTTPKDNGIYVLTTVGSGATNWVLTRATDFDQASASEVAVGASVIVVNGTANAHTNWVETGQGPFTVDTTAIVFDLVTSSANGSVNTGLINQLGYYAAGGTAISGLATSASGVLVTSAGSVPSISTTLPSGLSATNMTLVTPTIGSATATAINGNTLTAGSWTLTGAASKTLTFNNNLTLAGVDGKTETFNNTLTFAGTDGTTMTFPTTSKTLAANDYSNLTTLTANAFLTGGGAATAPNAVALTGIVKGNGASAPTAVTAPAGAIVGTSDTQNLTNKTNTDPIETAAHVGTTGFTATANTTLQTLAGLDQTFTAAGSYSCEGFLHFTTAPTSSNGAKIALVGDGTVSVTTLMFNAQGLTSTGTPAAFGTATALAGNAFAATVAMTDISFNAAIKINVGGVIHVQLAQNAASGTTASTAGMQRWECHRAS